MTTEAAHEVTRILQAAGGERAQAVHDILPLVYEQLRAIAQQHMNDERADHTLQATALLHEAYVRLVGNDELNWESRGHFFIAAAEAMRRILIEHARARVRLKRGGPKRDRHRLPLSVVDLANQENSEEILSLDEAFRRLMDQSPDFADVVRLRFFGGLSVDQTAKALGVSTATVKRRWTWARAWLYREMTREDASHEREGTTSQPDQPS